MAGGRIQRRILWLTLACGVAALSVAAGAQDDWSPRYVPPQQQQNQPQPAAVPATSQKPPEKPVREFNEEDSAQAQPQAPAAAPTSGAKRKLQGGVEVAGEKVWTETGLELQAGDKVTISSQGKLSYAANQSCGPEGLRRTWRDLIRALPVNAGGMGTLIGKIGDDPAAVPFLVGAKKELTASQGGRLYLGINQTAQQVGEGSFHAKVMIVPAAQSTNDYTAAVKLAPTVFDAIPRRVVDKDGNQGDMVNFVLLGPEEKVAAAFAAAGWVQVDRTKKEAILHAVLATLSKDAYVQMPMSELYLFGRPQDFGFAQALPVEVVASRHHLRLWKAPAPVNGQTLWVGAATHDVGFEKDQRTGGVTHHIDPNVDEERAFVGQSLSVTGLVSGLDHVTPSNALQGEARTATGGRFRSDGHILVIVLK